MGKCQLPFIFFDNHAYYVLFKEHNTIAHFNYTHFLFHSDLMDPLQLTEEQKCQNSRERRKKLLEGKKIGLTSNINSQTSTIKPIGKRNKYVSHDETVLQQSNATLKRENRKRILNKTKELATSKRICTPSPQVVKPIPITTYKNQPQQTALSREKRKRIIQHNNLKPPSTNQAEASSISTTPLQSNHPLCEKENSTSSRQNRRRVISEKRVSPPFGMANAQRKSINTFNYTTPLAEITNAKQIFFTNHDHVTNTVDSSSITTTPLQSKLPHYHKENSTASRVNRTSVRLDKTVSPSFPIPNTPTISKKKQWCYYTFRRYYNF